MYLLNRLRYVLRHILYLSICLFFLYFSEPITFVGEGEYKINVVKMITVTDSFLELHQSDRGCQNEESFDTCTTRLYSDNIFKKCGCYIFNSMLPNKVMIFNKWILCIFLSFKKLPLRTLVFITESLFRSALKWLRTSHLPLLMSVHSMLKAVRSPFCSFR